MHQKLKAVYNGGVFVPREPCDLPEGAEVEVIVQDPLVLIPEVIEPAKRAHILQAVVKRMQKNPIPAGAAHPRREELHERH